MDFLYLNYTVIVDLPNQSNADNELIACCVADMVFPTAVTSVERFHINDIGNSGIDLSGVLDL